ncbi:MAG: YdiU family protein [Verrucomicrobia bacterium]|nr:YdiU family protein [Verrucomicrobiota bacterium]
MSIVSDSFQSTAGWKLEHSYAGLPTLFHRSNAPEPVRDPKLVILNHPLASELGLKPEVLQRQARVFGGNVLPEGARPLAQAYAGHQYGHFTTLGDGRAILLGEQITPTGERFDIQLKGSGQTPFSRNGDGRAGLGPMLREYIISEAMHALGIPTTRSLAVVTTGETVRRMRPLPGAVLTRIAASHIRVGTFEWAAAKGRKEGLQTLADYSIQRHYPETAESENSYLTFFESVMERQAKLISQWMHIGFIHGVMNTDNMAICGETIDYGPCAFMDSYDPDTVFSSIDHHGRYAYGNQPHIAQWNLARLAEALLPLFHEDEKQAIEIANESIQSFQSRYQKHWLAGMSAKLGLFSEEADDSDLIHDLLKWMQASQADFTNTFRTLSQESPDLTDPTFQSWLLRWKARREQQSQSRQESVSLMRRHNPAYIPRNHQVEEALSAASDRADFSVMQRLLEVLAKPYDHSTSIPEYMAPPAADACEYQTFCGT